MKSVDWDSWMGACSICIVIILMVVMAAMRVSDVIHAQGPVLTASPPADCLVVKPFPDCRVMEKSDFDKANLTSAQRKATHSAMVPNPSGKLPPGEIYQVGSSGDLVPLHLAPGLYVDDRWDPNNPIVRTAPTK